MVVGEATNWLTTWITYAIFRWVIWRYIKLPTIVRYKLGFDKGKPSEEEYFMLTSKRVSTVLLSVSLVHSRISDQHATSIFKKYHKEPKFFISNYLNNH
jgi:hypothetical protein